MTLTPYDLQRLRAAALATRYREIGLYGGMFIPGSEVLALVEYAETQAFAHVERALLSSGLRMLSIRNGHFVGHTRERIGSLYDVSAHSLQGVLHAIANDKIEEHK